MIFTAETFGFDAVLPEGLRSTGSKLFFGIVLLSKGISLDSMTLLMILWIIDGEIPKFFVILHWKMLFLRCCIVYPCRLSQSFAPSLLLKGSATQCYRDALLFLYPATDTWYWLVAKLASLTVRCSTRCFQSFIAIVETCCWHQIQSDCVFM